MFSAHCKISHPHDTSVVTALTPAAAAVFTYGAWACSAAHSPASTARHPATCLLPPRAAAGPRVRLGRLLPWLAGPGPAPRFSRSVWAGYHLCCCGEPRTTPIPGAPLHLWDPSNRWVQRVGGGEGAGGHQRPRPPRLPPGSQVPVTSDPHREAPESPVCAHTYPNCSAGTGSRALGWLLHFE